MTQRSWMLTALVCGLSLGCGGPSGPEKVTVRGTVTLNGEALESGVINFIPQTGKGASSGAAIEKGRYAAEITFGMKRVEIQSPRVIGRKAAYDTPDSPMMDILEERIPPQYNALSDLSAEVSAQQTTFDFPLKAAVK